MPTSNYMPDVTVHIAFDSGFLTPAASRTWTDVSDYVELQYGFNITCGRSDERSEADANQLTGLTLDNRDGRFSPFKTGGAYYPNVKLDRPIRVTADPVDGASQVEFLGFINDWGTTWDGAKDYPVTTISATSRLARLGAVAGLKSVIEMAILTDGPVAYYTLGESGESTQANDSSGNKADPLVMGDATHPVVFGSATGPGTDGLTAGAFTASFATTGGITFLRGSVTLASTSVTLETSFLINEPAPAFTNLIGIGNGANWAYVRSDSSGFLTAVGTGGSITSPTALSVGGTHHLALTISGTTWTLYGDGASLVSGAVSALATGVNYITVGNTTVPLLSFYGDGTWVEDHVAIFNSVLTAPQILAHSTAILTGYAGETTSARLIRYAGYAGVESAEISAEAGQTTMQHVDTTDRPALDLMRVCEATEGGVLFDDRDGTTAFHNRAHRLTAASAFTLDMAQQMVESDYQPKLDRTGLANDITAQDVTGQWTAHVFDAQSRNVDNGVATLSIETASEDDDEPLFQASWALYKYKAPRTRIPTLSVDALAQVGKNPDCATVMSANVGTKITTSNRPSQEESSSGTFFVEGYTRAYGPESLVITFNVSPTSPEDTTYIVGDSTGRGVIGTNPIAL